MKKHLLLVISLVMVLGVHSQPCIPNPSSILFDGTSTSVRLNSNGGSLEPTAAVTVEAWIYPTVWGSAFTSNSILCHHSWNPGTYGYVLRCGSDGLGAGTGMLSFNLGTSIGWEEVTSPAGSMSLNTWYHVAGTFDGTTLNVYINGVLSGTQGYSGTILTSSFPARIGGLSDTAVAVSPRYFTGMIDEVRVWNLARSQADIAANMGDHIDPTGQVGLVGYWRFNENSGGTANDLSGMGNYGIILNGSWTSQVPFNNAPPAQPVITYVSGHLHSSSATGNQWYLGTTLISGATGQNYTPTQIGTYYVMVSVSANCTATSLPFSYNPVGIDNLTAKTALLISPNPAKDILNIQQGKDLLYDTYEIADLTGKIILKGLLKQSPDNAIDISNCLPGIYFLKLTGESGKSLIRKIVKS